MTQIDYSREMGFVAVALDHAGTWEMLGEARAVTDPDNIRAEFAVSVRSDCKGRGLGHLLLDKVIAYCRAQGTRELVGATLPDNVAMIQLASACGFAVDRQAPGEEVRLHRSL